MERGVGDDDGGAENGLSRHKKDGEDESDLISGGGEGKMGVMSGEQE